MKKLLALLLALLMAVTTFTALAEGTETEDATESQFETVLMKKGSLLIKEFLTYGSLPEADDGELYSGADVEAATLIDVETGSKYKALRLETYYYNSQYDSGTVVGTLDMDEIDDAIAALAYIKDHINEQQNYTEIVYTAKSGLVIGAYKTSKVVKLFIKYSSRFTAYYDLSSLDKISGAFAGAKEMLEK